MKVLNLGCGTQVSPRADVINIDYSPILRIKLNPLLRLLARFFLSKSRYQRMMALPNNIKFYDLSRGIPYPDSSIDIIYHSHLLEHLHRDKAVLFLEDCYNKLIPGGIIRISVPDLEVLSRNYVSSIEYCAKNPDKKSTHEKHIYKLIEQMVRVEASGTSSQGFWMRKLENLLLGSASRRGQTHKWMYDSINLSLLLYSIGFSNVSVQRYDTSYIQDWHLYGLDAISNGKEYKPGSLYIEAIK